MNQTEQVLLRYLSTVIQRRRQELAMSQDAVAELAGLSRTYFSDIERSRRNFSVVTLTAIAKALSTRGSNLLQAAEALANGE